MEDNKELAKTGNPGERVAARLRVALIGCGGTISSMAESSTDVMDYPEFGQKMLAADVLEMFGEVRGLCEIATHDFRSMGSSAFGPREWFELRDRILAIAKTGVDGIVILHGTATLEETAYALQRLLKLHIPVVLTGAQRPANCIGSDAGSNLLAAVRTAISPLARDKGVLVVLNDEIHSARDVVKSSNYRLQTFCSPLAGPLGHVEGDGVRLFRFPLAERVETSWEGLNAESMPRVDIVYSSAGSDGSLIDAAVQLGARGIVSMGLAPGLPTPGERGSIARAQQAGVVIVQGSRAHHGYVPERRYLREQHLIPAGELTPCKCRILLMLGIAAGKDFYALRESFSGA